MNSKSYVQILAAVVLVLSATSYSGAQLRSFDYPGADSTFLYGINNAGQVVGEHQDLYGYSWYGFLTNFNGNFIDPLNAVSSQYGRNQMAGINNFQQMVGWYAYTDGLLYNYPNGGFTVLDPGPTFGTYNHYTEAYGINDHGEVSGLYKDTRYHGWVWENGIFTPADFPGSSNDGLIHINNAGVAVGSWSSGGPTHGWIYDHGASTSFDCAGATDTYLDGINNVGFITGAFTNSAGETMGFWANGSVCNPVAFPGASTTWIDGINDNGQFVGWYTDANGYQHGLLGTIPEPGTILMLATGILGIAGTLRRKLLS